MLSWLKKLSPSTHRAQHLKKLTRPEYAYLYEPAHESEWVSLDFEMTGLDPKSDHILSVGAVRIIQDKNGLWLDSAGALSIVCRPPVMPSDDSIIVHGLRPCDVASGVDYETMLGELLPFIGNRAVVGFCTEMDMAFLNALVKPFLGTPLINECLDVSLMEQALAQKQHSGHEMLAKRKHLTTLLEEYAIPRLPAHDALNDALMTAMVFCHLKGRKG